MTTEVEIIKNGCYNKTESLDYNDMKGYNRLRGEETFLQIICVAL